MNPVLGKTKDFRDPDVCKYLLASGFCPYDLFPNTKLDLGNCPSKVHDEKLKKQYDESPDKGRLGYEPSFAHFVGRLLADMERTVLRARQKLEQSAPEESLVENDNAEREERVAFLEAEIAGLTEQMEKFGEEGEVEKAQELLEKVEQLKTQMETIKT
ncbi:hypothetical protein HDV05_006171, partial [Chytridiales sp. JEL 0842]